MGEIAFDLGLRFTMMCECCVCGIPIVTTVSQEKRLREANGGKDFFCLNGHRQSFGGTAYSKLQHELAATSRRLEEQTRSTQWARNQRDQVERRLNAAKGQITKIKNRVGNGVCPCCSRTFQNLMRHMQTKHPDYKHEDK